MIANFYFYVAYVHIVDILDKIMRRKNISVLNNQYETFLSADILSLPFHRDEDLTHGSSPHNNPVKLFSWKGWSIVMQVGNHVGLKHLSPVASLSGLPEIHWEVQFPVGWWREMKYAFF